MTTEEKAAAFDTLARAMTSQLYDGKWRWICPTPCGGHGHATEAGAVADLLEWAQRIVKKQRKPTLMQIELQNEQAIVAAADVLPGGSPPPLAADGGRAAVRQP